MNELVNYNLFNLATGPLPSSSWAYNPDVEKYDQDLDKAEQLLDDAGYPRGTDGIRFSLELIVGTTGRDKGLPEMEILRSQLEEVGIKLELKVYDEATTTQLVAIEHNFDMYLIAGLSTAPDPNMISGYLHSDRILIDNPVPALYNHMVFSNDRVDELFEMGLIETDVEERKKIYHELQDIIVDELPCYYLIEDRYPHFFWEDFVGIPAGPYGGARERLDDVYWVHGSDLSPEGIQQLLTDVENEIKELEDKNYDVTAAEAKLTEAKTAYMNNDYSNAVQLANEAVDLAEPPQTNYLMYGLIGIVIVAAIIIIVMRRR